MKNNDRDNILIRLDEKMSAVHGKLENLEKYIIAVDGKVQVLATKVASSKWHDWAIKGGIVAMLALGWENFKHYFAK